MRQPCVTAIGKVTGGLAFVSLIGVRVLEAPLAGLNRPSLAIESQTDLERPARTVPAGKVRTGAGGTLPLGQIDFTSTANSSAKRSIQAACHGERTVRMIAPAGGNPIVLSTCAAAKSGRE
jgi:hypothetical protein